MLIIGLLGLIFVETLAALVGLSASFLVFRQFASRRRLFLPLFGVTYLFLGLTFVSLFLVQFGATFGFDDRTVAALLPYPYMFASLGGMTALLAVAHMYLPVGIRRVLYGIIAGAFITYLALARVRDVDVVYVNGLPFADLDLADALRLTGGTLLSFLALTLAPLVAIVRRTMKGKRVDPSNWYILGSGIAGIAYVVLRLVSDASGSPVSLIASLSMTVVLVILSLTGALSWQHPDRRVIERPHLVFARSYLFKTAFVNTIIFGLLAFLLVGFTASQFTRTMIDAQLQQMRDGVDYRATQYAVAADLLRQDASQLAIAPSVIAYFGSEDLSRASAAFDDFLHRYDPGLTVRLVSLSGDVLFSSDRPADRPEHQTVETDQQIDSQVFRSAVRGEPTTAVEQDIGGSSGPVLRAAAPVLQPGTGRIMGVVMIADPNSRFLGSVIDITLPPIVVGHGFVTDSGLVVYEAGKTMDALSLHTLSNRLFGRDHASGTTDDGMIYEVAKVYQSEGAADGFVYAFTDTDFVVAAGARIMVIVTLLSLLASLIMISVLVFITIRSLQPVRDLVRGAKEIEKGNFAVKIDHTSMDEFGVLADAFNHMTDTIGSQTATLKEALREQKDFLIHTAQEMRTPLNHFRWTLEMLRFGEVGSLNQEQLEMVDQLNRTSDRLQRMVQNIMDANRLTEGSLVPQRKAIQLEETIDDAAGAVVVDVRRKNINLHWRYPDRPLPRVSGDAKMLQRVMSNLLSNAVKYTPRDGHIEISVRRVEEQRPGGRKGPYLQVSIEDNGVGIPKDEQERVFSLFFRSRNVVASDIEGAGLGLFITKKLVDLHKGAIWFESDEQKGSTFTFTVPLAGGEEEHDKPHRSLT